MVFHNTKIITKTLILSASLVIPFSTGNAADLDTIKADCYMEGEGEGLQGNALESFVKDCIKELSGLDLGDNSVQVKKGFDK